MQKKKTSPFFSDIFAITVHAPSDAIETIVRQNPCLVLSTSGFIQIDVETIKNNHFPFYEKNR
jgi:hypothetical protein